MPRWTTRGLGARSTNLDRRRVPVRSSDRRPGPYPYYGASGVVDHVDSFLFDGLHLLVAEDGENLRSRKTPVAFLANGKFWVNNHAHILTANKENDTRFLAYALEAMDISGYITGSVQPKLTQAALASIRVCAPAREEQLGIAATLGALDDKIESNHRARDLIKGLLLAAFEELLAKNNFEEVPLAGIATSTKGVSYKSVDLLPSRTSLVTLKSIDRSGGYKSNGLKQYVGPYKPQQVTLPGDIVVAQTDLTQGAEVVGRAVRVPPEDSAATLVASLDLVIVRPNPDIPTEYLLGVLTDERFRAHCCSRTSGTTVLHLASDAIPTYMAPLVGTDVREDFASRARPLVERGDGLASETRSLIALRDTLLPELLSGRIRVSEARGVVEEAVG
jgi:type I restriction enzyme S subunit